MVGSGMAAVGTEVHLGTVANSVGVGAVCPGAMVLGAAVLSGVAANLVGLVSLAGFKFHSSISLERGSRWCALVV